MDRIADVEDRHWWFEGRRALVASALDAMGLPPDAHLLDAGAGSGGTLPLLARYGTVRAFELDAAARERASARGVVDVVDGRLPDAVPYPDERFDAVVLLDVLEHVRQDVRALDVLRQRLAPGGRLLVTVPANDWMWSAHDVANHHMRRYSRRSLRWTAERAGLAVETLTYTNAVLFPITAAVRLAERWRPSLDDGLALPPPAVNRALGAAFAAERWAIGRVPLPFGVSLLLVARDGRQDVGRDSVL